MDLHDAIETTRFVGEEFLTWLWFQSDTQDGVFVEDDQEIELRFDNQLTLEANLAEAERSRLTGGSPSDSTEAKVALQAGKRVAQAKMRVIRDGREWVLSVTARTLAISGLKIPAVLSRQEDDKFFERMALIEEIDATMRGLYKSFLNVRLDRDAWAETIEEMRTWVYAEDA